MHGGFRVAVIFIFGALFGLSLALGWRALFSELVVSEIHSSAEPRRTSEPEGSSEPPEAIRSSPLTAQDNTTAPTPVSVQDSIRYLRSSPSQAPPMPPSMLGYINSTFFTDIDDRIATAVSRQTLYPQSDKEVLLVSVSGGSYGPLVEELAVSLRHFGREDQLLIFCLDAVCEALCMQRKWRHVLVLTLLKGGESSCGKDCLGDVKIALCWRLSAWRLSFLFFDLDVFLNKDPFAAGLLPLGNSSWYLQVQSDHLAPTLYTWYNFGFFLSRGCDHAEYFWREVYALRFREPKGWDQGAFDLTLRRRRFHDGVVRLSEQHFVNYMHHMVNGLQGWSKTRVERYWGTLRDNATMVHLTCVETPELRLFVRKFLFGWGAHRSSPQSIRKERLLGISGEQWNTGGVICTVQLRFILLLELAHRTGRKVVLPYSVVHSALKHPHLVVVSFRFFDLRYLLDLVVEPNYVEQYNAVAGARPLSNTTLTLSNTTTLSDMQRAVDSAPEDLVMFNGDDSALLTSLGANELPLDRLLHHLGTKTAKVCYWVEEGAFATTVPWCLGQCMKEKAVLPEYRPSEFQPNASQIDRVRRQYPLCAPH